MAAAQRLAAVFLQCSQQRGSRQRAMGEGHDQGVVIAWQGCADETSRKATLSTTVGRCLLPDRDGEKTASGSVEEHSVSVVDQELAQ